MIRILLDECIPVKLKYRFAEARADFQVSKVLDAYKRPYDPKHPVVCMDESPKQLIAETRTELAMQSGKSQAHRL